jgi:hypothetical protein
MWSLNLAESMPVVLSANALTGWMMPSAEHWMYENFRVAFQIACICYRSISEPVNPKVPA